MVGLSILESLVFGIFSLLSFILLPIELFIGNRDPDLIVPLFIAPSLGIIGIIFSVLQIKNFNKLAKFGLILNIIGVTIPIIGLIVFLSNPP